MKTIWKFELKGFREYQTITFPKGSKVLCAKMQATRPVIYALVDPSEKEKETIGVKIFGTGHPIPDSTNSWTYLDTLMELQDAFVWHIFYKL